MPVQLGSMYDCLGNVSNETLVAPWVGDWRGEVLAQPGRGGAMWRSPAFHAGLCYRI